MSMTQEEIDEAAVAGIEFELTELAEERISEDMSDADYFRQMDDLLGNVPTPPAPAHLQVLKKAKFWQTSGLITRLMFDQLRARLNTAAHGSAGAGGSSTGAAPIPSPQPAPSPPVLSQPIDVDAVAPTKARASPAELKQATLFFGTTMGIASASGQKTPQPQATVPVAPAGNKPATTRAPTPKPDTAQVLDQERPVRLSISFGYARIKVSLATRMNEAQLPNMRTMWKDHEKVAILARVAGRNNSAAADFLKTQPGFERMTSQLIGRWRKEAATAKERAMAADAAAGAAGGSGSTTGKRKRKRKHAGGRKPNLEFEQAVLDQLIFTSLEKVDGKDSAVIEANVTFSYALIIHAGQKVQKEERFKSNPKVQSCKFSRKWIGGMLRRHALRRRRITASDKVLPEPAIVQGRMVEIQKTIVDGKFTRDETISADETGIFFGAAPKHQIVPKDAARATAPESNDKARFTLMLFGTAAGEMGPAWSIIKCSVKGVDLSSARVLNTLHEEPGFTASEGWALKVWERQLTLKGRGKNKETTAIHKRPYLIHKETLEVVTVQIKAWMDTPGIVMWSEIQMKQWVARRTGRALIVWDNCGPHKTAAVKEAFVRDNITQEELTPKMTDILQVMDLIANGPLKSGIRRERCDQLFDYFQNWKLLRLKAQVDKTTPPKFAPPKPKVADGLRITRKVCQTTFATEKYKESMRQCFVDVGLSPFQGTGITDDGGGVPFRFREYNNHRRGTLAFKVADADSQATCLGEVAAELQMVPREGADSDAMRASTQRVAVRRMRKMRRRRGRKIWRRRTISYACGRYRSVVRY